MKDFFPDLLITYLLAFRQSFSTRGFVYFQGFIAALLITEGRKCVTRVAHGCFFIEKSLSSWESFLSQSSWDSGQVSERLMALVLDKLGHGLLYAHRYLVAIDTTYALKVKGRMLGVQRWSQSSQNPDRKATVVGHHWAIAGLLSFIDSQWQCFPLLTRLISGQTRPSHFVVSPEGESSAMSFWDAVLAVVFVVASSVTSAPLCVVADAYFAKAPFLNPLIEKGIGVVSRLRHDAVGFDDPLYCGRGRPPKKGKKWKLAQLWEHLEHQTVRAHLYGKTICVPYVVYDVWIRDVTQKVRVVVVEGVKHPILLVSTSMSLSAKEIIEIYAARFALELAIRDLKQHIGFCDYQSITTIAFLRFAQLCCCALSIGRLILCQAKSQPWLNDESKTAGHETALSVRKLRRCLRQFVLRRLLFSKSASDANFKKSQSDLEAIFRLAA
jgi:hypothetical protein